MSEENRKWQFILDEETKEVTPAGDLLDWARWMEEHDRRVARWGFIVKLPWNGKPILEVLISTVFLGLDHSFNPNSQPLVFETMMFVNNTGDVYVERYTSWDEAVAGHGWAVKRWLLLIWKHYTWEIRWKLRGWWRRVFR